MLNTDLPLEELSGLPGSETPDVTTPWMSQRDLSGPVETNSAITFPFTSDSVVRYGSSGSLTAGRGTLDVSFRRSFQVVGAAAKLPFGIPKRRKLCCGCSRVSVRWSQYWMLFTAGILPWGDALTLFLANDTLLCTVLTLASRQKVVWKL